MNKFILLFSAILIVSVTKAQNVGQKGDTLLNYTDINGLKQGAWKKLYENNKVQYETYFVDNKPVGDFKRYNKNGDLIALLKHTEGSELARATLYHTNGKKAAFGNYIAKKKDSIWNYLNDGGVCYLVESYKEGIKHGTFKTYTSERVLIEEVEWTNGVKHGQWKKYYVNGKPMWNANYENGKLDGEIKTYYLSGGLHKEGVFRNDLMEGPWKIYGENGNLKKIYQYKNGVCPEVQEEENDELKELLQNKDQIDGPQNANDVEWLRGNRRY